MRINHYVMFVERICPHACSNVLFALVYQRYLCEFFSSPHLPPSLNIHPPSSNAPPTGRCF